jgi:hypothetical protein
MQRAFRHVRVDARQEFEHRAIAVIDRDNEEAPRAFTAMTLRGRFRKRKIKRVKLGDHAKV